ncbi:MAG: GH1 family beta-glucosidase [Trueperaceae bacterium]
MPDENKSLPTDFVWGVATSAYQIEGATGEDGRGVSIWDTFCRTPGKVAEAATGDVACDHYHRWREDLDLIAALGVGGYRFSVSWPRILPEGRGRVEQRGLDFYDRLVDGLLEREVLPFATLYHWDLPQRLEDAGGWTSRATVDAFVEYADAVTERLGDRVSAYATLNEPWCSAYLGYTSGEHAPGLRSRRKGLQASHHLLLAHGKALPVMRGNAPSARHGVVLNLNPAYPASDDERDRQAAVRYDGFFNRWFLDPIFLGRYPADAWQGYEEDVPLVRDGDLAAIAAPLDFLGVNYYSRTVLRDRDGEWPAAAAVAPQGPVTDMGWEVFPRGLTDLLCRLDDDYPVPDLYVTENGAAYADMAEDGRVHDANRIGYLAGHMAAIRAAVDRGVPVRGYFAWSLLDNFEWAHGYDKRFGLVHVDYETQIRTLKASADWYASSIAANGVLSTSR